MNPGRSRKKFPRVLATSVAALLGLAAAAWADSGTWTGLVGPSWTDDGNWTVAPFPNGSGQVATFDGAAPFNPTITDFEITVGEVVFTAAAATPYTITLQGTGSTTSLTFDTTGVTNNSGTTHLFTTGTGGSPTSFIFTNSASAGSNIGWTIASSGTMLFNNSSSAGSSTITIESGGITEFNATSTAGNANLTVNGGGTLNFNSTSFADNSTINILSGGSVFFTGSASAASTATVINASGGTFDISARSGGLEVASIEGGGSFNLGGEKLTVGSTDLSKVVSGVISGTGGSLTKLGATSTLTLNGANTYTGTTTIAGGTITLGANGSLDSNSSVDITVSGGILNIAGKTGASQQFFSLKGVTGSEVQIGTKNLIVAEGTFDGAITGTTGSLTKTDSFSIFGDGGFLVLKGANTFTGGTTIAAGTLTLAGDGSLSDTGSVTLVAHPNVNSLNDDPVFDISGINLPSERIGALTVAADGTITLGSKELIFGDATNTTIAGAIEGAGGSITKEGSGTVTLTGTNIYTGTTKINAGSIVLDSTGSLSDLTLVNTAVSGTTFNISGINANGEEIGALQGVAGSSVILGAKNLVTGGNNMNTTFGGVISGTGNVFKEGAGAMVVTGVNTYSGATVVNQGTFNADTTVNATVLNSASTLAVGGGRFLLTGAAGTDRVQIMNGLIVNGGASIVEINVVGNTTTLDLRGTSGTQGIQHFAGGTVDFRSTIPGDLGSTARILTAQQNNAAGIIGSWATTNGGTDFASVNANGVIVPFTGYSDIGALGPIPVPNGVNLVVRINLPGTVGPVPLSQATTSINSLTQNFTAPSTIDTTNGTLRVGADGGIFINTGKAALTIGLAPTANAGNLTAGGTPNASGNLTLGNFSASLMTINAHITDNGTGEVSVTKTGSGTTTLTNTNTYTGATIIGDGTLSMTGDATLSDQTSLNLTGATAIFNMSGIMAAGQTVKWLNGVTGSQINLGAKTLTLNSPDGTNFEFAGNIIGAGGKLVKNGPGIQVLSGNNTFNGGVTFDNGTLVTNSNSALGTGTLTVTGSANTRTLFSSVQDTTLNNPINLNGNLEIGTGAFDFHLHGKIDLGGATRTIIGIGTQNQIHFGGGATGGFTNGGLTLTTKSTLNNPGNYVAFIFDDNVVNTYTGLTTIEGRAFMVLTTVSEAIKGNVLIQGNGVLDYLGTTAEQIDDAATVTVNSLGNTIPSGASTQQFAGLDLFMANGTEEIGLLNGNGLIWVAAARLSVTGGNFSGSIQDGAHAGRTGGGLTKRGAGDLTLSGVSSYTGQTDLQVGKILLTGAGTLGNGTTLQMATGTTFDISGITGASASVGALSSTATDPAVILGSKNLTIGGNNSSTTFAGIISGAGGSLTKIGTGTQTLTNVNTYSGPTTVNGGVLDANISNVSNVLSSSSALSLGGGTFQLRNTLAAAKIQVLDGLTLTAGSNSIVIDNEPGDADTTLNLRGLSGTKKIDRSAGATVDFRSPTASNFSTSAKVFTAQPNDATGIIGTWATVNNGAAFAMVDNTGLIVAFNNYYDIAARAGGVPPPDSIIPNDPLKHVRINAPGVAGSVTLAAPITTIASLTQNTTTASVVDLGGPAGVLKFGATGGIFIAPGKQALTIGTAPGVGSITAGGVASGVPGELILGNFNALLTDPALTINANITDNGFADVSVIKTGSGLVNLAGTNTYQGPTIVAGGRLALIGPGSLSNGTAVSITNAGASFSIAGISASNESIGSLSGVIGSFVLLGTKQLTAGGNGDSTTFAGVISGVDANSGSFVKDGSGTLIFTGQNTYGNLTRVNAGTLILNTTGGNALASNLSVRGGRVVLQQSHQILDSKTIVVSDDGIFDIGANSETVAGVKLEGGSILGTTGVLTSSTTFIVESGLVTANLTGTANTVGLNKETSGTVTLAGQNTYRGPTNVNGGILILDGSITGLLNGVNVNNGSEFDVTGNGFVIVGDGITVVKATDGNTVNNAGQLIGGSNSTGVIAGNKNTIVNSGQIVPSGGIVGGAVGFKGVSLIGSDNFVSNSGFIGGDKALVTSNATGSNLAVNYGILIGTSGTAVDSTASTGDLAFTNVQEVDGAVRFGTGNDTMTIATKSFVTGIIDGGNGTNALRLVGGSKDTLEIGTDRIVNFASLYKGGGGTWTLTGEGTFPNGTIVNMGNLIVQGNLISDVVVEPLGLLGGIGTITGNVINYGTVSPGNSPGVMTIKGNYDQRETGTLEIEIQGKGDGQHDLLKVEGTARLGGTLRIKNGGRAPTFRMGDKITFLIADGGVEGKFKKVENPFRTDTIIKMDVLYESNAVSIAAAQGSYEEFARTHELTINQRATAKVIDGAIASGTNAKMVDYLNNRPIERIPEELDRIAPDELGAIYRVGVNLASVQHQNVQRRTDDLRLSNRRVNTSNFQAAGNAPVYSGQFSGGAAGPQGEAPEPPVKMQDRRWGAFLNGMGEWIRIGDTDNARGYDFSTGGVTVGVDYKVNQNFAVGVSAGYANTAAQLPGRGDMEVNGGKLGVYATYFDGGFYVDAAVSGGLNSYETRRAGLQGSARGRTEGAEINAMVGTGYDWTLESLTLGALTSVEYTYLGFDGFEEDGSLAPLRYPGQSAQSLRAKLGFKVVYDWQIGKVLVKPELRAAWQHEFAARSFAIDSAFASGGGGTFTVDDPAVGRDSLLLGLGGSVFLGSRAATYLFYDGELFRKESDSHNISGGVRISF